MSMLYFLDLFGVFVFAVSGALDGVKHRLDLLGISVLATVTGVGGGIMRDVILGETPPAAFHDESVFFMCLLGSLIVILSARHIERFWHWVRVADAIGLGVFTAIGSVKAMQYGLGVIGVLMLGTMTAVGGGLIRDLLVREVPLVLRADFYATAALLGAGAAWIANLLGAHESWQIYLAAGTTITLRLLAMKFHFSLPTVHRP